MATSGAQPGNQNATTGKRWRDAINRALAKRARSDAQAALDALAEKLLMLCDGGDLGALKELGDRVDGKAVQGLEHSGPDGGAIPIEKIERVIVRPPNSDG